MQDKFQDKVSGDKILGDKILGDKIINIQVGGENAAEFLPSFLKNISSSIALDAEKQASDTLNSIFSEEINEALELRNDHNIHQAIEELKRLEKPHKWGKLSNTLRFRVKANLGICYLDIKDRNIGGDYLIESYSFDPENVNALAYVTLGYALKNNNEKFQHHFDLAKSKDPGNTIIYTALIQIKSYDPNISFDEIVSLIPDKLREESQITHNLGITALQLNNFDKALTWLEKTKNLLPTGNAKLYELQANIIAIRLENLYLKHQSSSKAQSIEKLHIETSKLINELLEVWNNIKERDDSQLKANYLFNLSFAHSLLQQNKEAYDYINQCVELEDTTESKIRLADLALKINKPLEALDVLQRIPPNEDNVTAEVSFMKGQVFLLQKEEDKALAEFFDILKTANVKIPEKLILNTYYLVIDILLAKNETGQKLDKLYHELSTKYSDHILTLITKAKIHIHKEEKQDAVTCLLEALEIANDENHQVGIPEIILLAEHFAKIKFYEDSIQLLENIVDANKYDLSTQLLLGSYYNGKQRLKAQDLCENLIENGIFHSNIIEVLALTYTDSGRYNKGIEVCTKYLEKNPSDALITLRLAIIYFHNEEYEKVKSTLNKIIKLDLLSFDARFQYADLCIKVKYYGKALEVAYQTRNDFYSDGDAHFNYFVLVTRIKDLSFLTIPNQVSLDTSIILGSIQGKNSVKYTIVNKNPQGRTEILVTSSTIQQLLGKKVGTQITISSSGFDKTYIIERILSKYQFAFLESQELLSEKFINEKFQSFQTPSKLNNPKEDLHFIYEQVDKQSKIKKLIDQKYSQGVFPIGTYAIVQKRSIIEAWNHLAANVNLGFKSSFLPYELQIILQSRYQIFTFSEIILDITSLLTFKALNQLHLLEKLPQQAITTKSTLKEIDAVLEQLEFAHEGMMSIGKENGKYVYQKFSKEQIDQETLYYTELKKWCEKNLQIKPSYLTIKGAVKTNLDEQIGKSFSDVISVAQQEQVLLLSGDNLLRDLAYNSFDVNSLSIPALFLVMANTGFVNEDEFVDLFATLFSLNYKNLAVTDKILFNALEKSKYNPNHYPFKEAVKGIKLVVHTQDAIAYVVNFLYQVYKSDDNILRYHRALITSRILQSLFQDCNSPKALEHKFKVNLDEKFMLLQPQKDEILKSLHYFILC